MAYGVKKMREAISESRANLNTSASVSVPILAMIRVRAALNHVVPTMVFANSLASRFSSTVHANQKSVRRVALRCLFFIEASARRAFAAEQEPSINGFLVSAIANTKPVVKRSRLPVASWLLSRVRQVQNGPASEALTFKTSAILGFGHSIPPKQVLEMGSRGGCGLPRSCPHYITNFREAM